jgi:hypothetical protein
MKQFDFKSLNKKAKSVILRHTGDRKEIATDMEANVQKAYSDELERRKGRLQDLQEELEIANLTIAEYAPTMSPKGSEVRMAELQVKKAARKLEDAYAAKQGEMEDKWLLAAAKGENYTQLIDAFFAYQNRDERLGGVAEERKELAAAKRALESLRKDPRMEELEAQKANIERQIEMTSSFIEQFEAYVGSHAE